MQGWDYNSNHASCDAQWIAHVDKVLDSTPPDPLFTVPFPRDPDYVDRGPLIDEIHEKLGAPAARVALVGLGGVGKSQLAIEYAHRVREASPSTWVLWLHASSAARFELSVRDTLEQLKVPGRAEAGANVFQLFRSWLRDEKRGKWLIILDNVDDARFLLEPPSSAGQVASASQVMQHRERHLDYLPASRHGSILVTSRSEQAAIKITDKHGLMTVEPMREALAVELVRKKLGCECAEQDVVKLVEALDHMPLAISQASAYISQRMPRYSILQYVEKLQETDRSGLSLLDFDGGALRRWRDREASNSIMLTWQISFEHIREIRPSAAHLLSLMSFFDCQSIPCFLLRERGTSTRMGENWMKKWARAVLHWLRLETVSINPVESKQVNQNTEDEENEWDVIVLRNYSFMSITAEVTVFKMHRLVQLATQRWLKSHGRLERWSSQFISNLDSAFPTGKFEVWAACQPLLPHAIAALEVDLLSTEARLQQAGLLLKSGAYAQQQGSVAIAGRMAAFAMEVCRKVLPEGHQDTLLSINNLAVAYSDEGRWDEAETLLVEVMETSKAMTPEGHIIMLKIMGTLASVYRHQGRWEEAEKLQVEAMETSKSVLPERDPDMLWSMGNLAETYVYQGRWEEAEKLQVEVMETNKAMLSEGHPDTLTCMINLATTYWNEGRWEEAEKLLVEVVEMSKTVLPEGHPETLRSMGNLAMTYIRQGRWGEAEKLQVEVMETSKAVLPERHPATLRSMSNLAMTYVNQGRWGEAEKLQVEVMETSKAVLPEGHPDTLMSMCNLAMMYSEQGRWEEAEELQVEVMETRKAVLPEGHPDTLTSMAILAITLRKLGRRQSSVDLMRQCIALSSDRLGPRHPDTLDRCRRIEAWAAEEMITTDQARRYDGASGSMHMEQPELWV
ncbi:hypothetical protein B0A54_17934 [Friedmanniomyces endolithicus]|uniref:Uncharacterized protein n=1 Tax=Friedmanniomyces endolithicus TaxID=329885 RepID=A0A4U0TQC6_9PEZI|nr:hypothetical protein B0A54_17934 [Friedmanniomyces endolithicus]